MNRAKVAKKNFLVKKIQDRVNREGAKVAMGFVYFL